ncbi:Probable N-acetyltransferase HLS1 [Linum grandiflorum]
MMSTTSRVAAVDEFSADVERKKSAAESVVVREFDGERDTAEVEEMERRCEVGQHGKPSLVTDLMGDPICRVRHFPLHVMMVAEFGEGREIVGVVRACIKTVSRGGKASNVNDYVKLAYILGLRVSPFHRRLGIGAKLVAKVEEWSRQNGAVYAYMATDCTNQPSINLFTGKFSYAKFRTPAMLVQPVHAHRKSLPSSIAIVKLTPRAAELIYRKVFKTAEFVPKDIDSILSSKLNLGTFMAVSKKHVDGTKNNTVLPTSFAIMSIWNTKEVFKMQVKSASRVSRACCAGSWWMDTWLPCLKLPSINPKVFGEFGVRVMYGLHMEGKGGGRLMRALCGFAHNMARSDESCGGLVVEVGPRDPVRKVVPHWRRFSWEQDIWCIKKLEEEEEEECEPSDWDTSSGKSSVIFVDPRDF